MSNPLYRNPKVINDYLDEFLNKYAMKELNIKVCPDPQCEAVWHNCPTEQKKCLDCGGNIKIVNEKTYLSKFKDNWFQYDFLTGEYYRHERTNPL